MTGRGRDYHAALASPSRRQILDALVAAEEPLDATAVAARLGLHVTTVRFHLDQLSDTGLARRRPSTEGRRGRPRVLYSATGAARETDGREQLIEVLADALSHADHPADDAAGAGRRWAESFAPDTGGPVDGLVEVLDQIGFDPQPTADGSAIRLRACPFRAAAREHPDVVCSVHSGLVQRLLDGAGPPARLLPFVEPELCLISFESDLISTEDTRDQ